MAFLGSELDGSESELRFHTPVSLTPKKIPLQSALILSPSYEPENMSVNKKEYITIYFFYVLLTVHLSIILIINQLNAQI